MKVLIVSGSSAKLSEEIISNINEVKKDIKARIVAEGRSKGKKKIFWAPKKSE